MAPLSSTGARLAFFTPLAPGECVEVNACAAEQMFLGFVTGPLTWRRRSVKLEEGAG